MNGRAGRLAATEKQAAAVAVKGAFARGLSPDASAQQRLFAAENDARRTGLLGVLIATGSEFTDADIAGFLPKADASDKSNPDALSSPAFADLAPHPLG